MPNWPPPRLATATAVTNYFVLTYDIPVLARGVPKTSWDRIISLSCEFALVLAYATLVPFLLKWGRTPILFFALGFCPHSHALDEPQDAAGILAVGFTCQSVFEKWVCW